VDSIERLRLRGDISGRGEVYPVADAHAGVVVYTSIMRGFLNPRLVATSLKTGQSKLLETNGTQALGIFVNHLVYVREDGALLAVPFDSRKLEVTGSPIPLGDGIQVTRGSAAAAISRSGTLLFVRGSSTSQPVVVDSRGVARPPLMETRRYAHPRYSPDGRTVAFTMVSAQTTDLWLADVTSGTFTRLTSSGNSERPEWMFGGKRVVYPSDRDSAGFYSIWWTPSDGSGQPEKVFSSRFSIREVIASPDNRYLIYREDHSTNRRDIHLLPLDGPRTSRPLLTTGFDELMPRISPDGKRLAYMSDETGQYEVYIRALPGLGGRVQVSTNGGTEPLWSRDGRLFYRQGTQLIAASIITAPSLLVSREVVFDGPYETHPFHPNYDAAPDGKSFLMLKTADDDTQVIAVVNWLDELRQRIAQK
jgi:dipeptidyl aminopeptidase/acylaminoacyl peptidase